MWDKKKPDTLQAAAPDATGWLGSSLHVKGDITGNRGSADRRLPSKD